MPPLIDAPAVPKKQWVAAQKLVNNGHFKLGFKMDDMFVIPSEKLVATLPGAA